MWIRKIKDQYMHTAQVEMEDPVIYIEHWYQSG
jgi:hypothetical protein